MMGGKAFIKSLPFDLGSNGAMVRSGIVDADLAAAQSIGMKWFRNDVPWNFTSGSFTGIESVAGTFSSANASVVASVAASVKSYGMNPLMVVTVNANPGLTSTWTSGPPTTPAQFAAMMGWLVAQPGLQGLHWELFNEPDGFSWGVPYALNAQAHYSAYSAMKSADPTCTVHGLVLEGIGPVGYGPETYYNNFVTAAKALGTFPTQFYDVADFHQYFLNAGATANDLSPDAYGGSNSPWPGWLTVANWQANRVAQGDTTPMWITEFGWQSTSDGSMTPQQQAQYYQNYLASILGNDPINHVAYSSYLKVMCQYAMEAGGAYWGIFGQPAVAVLTELVKGN